jgi:hypothetical protein
VGLEGGSWFAGRKWWGILLGCGHGGKTVEEGPCTTTTTLAIDITNGHELTQHAKNDGRNWWMIDWRCG